MSTEDTRSIGEQLYVAARDGHDRKVRRLLFDHPELDVNSWQDRLGERHSPLLAACINGNVNVVSLLLAHPDIDVNVKGPFGRTIFFHTINTNRKSDTVDACIVKLLEDDRVNVGEIDKWGHPFVRAIERDLVWTIQNWIAIRGFETAELEALIEGRHMSADIEQFLRYYIYDPVSARRNAKIRMCLPLRSPLPPPRTVFTRVQYSDMLCGKVYLDGSLAPVEHHLWYAADAGRTSVVKELLAANPSIDVHMQLGHYTVLQIAVLNANATIVALLLDTLKEDAPIIEHRPLLEHGHSNPDASLIRPLVLRCPYYKEKQRFWTHWICRSVSLVRDCIAYGHCDGLAEAIPAILKDAEKPEVDSGNWTRLKFDMVALLTEFQAYPEASRRRARRETNWYDKETAARFALIVFFCDGLLAVKPHLGDDNKAVRFFRIAARLPLELQMVLCHRVIGSGADNIRSSFREDAFRLLAEVVCG